MLTLSLVLFISPVQADPWETHLHNVEFLTRVVEDHPGVDLGFHQDAVSIKDASSELAKAVLSGEDLVLFLRARPNVLK